MRSNIVSDWLRCSWAVRFFSDFAAWKRQAKEYPLFSADWKTLLDGQEDAALR